MKIEHAVHVYWHDKESPTSAEVAYCFEEQDRWLPVYIFNTFGVHGNQAIMRMYERVRKLYVADAA